ncbi:hypothetical protein D3C72_2500140 [compost metagenome]
MHARNHIDQRRFAGAVVTDQGDDLARLDREAEILDGDDAAKALADIVEGQDRLGHCGHS